MSDTLTVDQAAILVGVPRAQLLIWAANGMGPPVSDGNPLNPASLRYRKRSLEAWIEEQPKGSVAWNR